MIQEKPFKQDVKSLASTKIIPSSSSIYTLNLYYDDDGLNRAFGRLNEVDLDQDTVHPILLPKKTAMPIWILKWCHQNIAYGGFAQ